MKKLVSLTLTMVLSAMTVMAISPYKMEKMAGHSVLKSTGEQAVVVAEFDHDEDITNMPVELQSLLDTYVGMESDDAAFIQFASSENDSVCPLLGKIEYDQGKPYNNLCPILNDGRAVTGCVATAMAQIMRYWKHPKVGVGEATYTSSTGATTFVFSQHPFDWDNMLEQYYSAMGYPTYNDNQATAVANLMLACGASVNMNYSQESSGSYISYSYNALRNHFGYSQDMKYYESDQPNWEDWTDNLKEQFDKSLPVLYAGTSTSGGHAFVLDGYKIEPTSTGGQRTMFHVNWGWGGHYNGWFLLRKLDPTGKDNYSNTNQRVVIDIRPVYPQAIEQTEAEKSVRAIKELRNGQVVIVRNNSIYTVQGQRIQ